VIATSMRLAAPPIPGFARKMRKALVATRVSLVTTIPVVTNAVETDVEHGKCRIVGAALKLR